MRRIKRGQPGRVAQPKPESFRRLPLPSCVWRCGSPSNSRDQQGVRTPNTTPHPRFPPLHSSMSKIITLVGAGGKMGCRITDNFVKSDHTVHYLEVSPKGLENL